MGAGGFAVADPPAGRFQQNDHGSAAPATAQAGSGPTGRSSCGLPACLIPLVTGPTGLTGPTGRIDRRGRALSSTASGPGRQMSLLQRLASPAFDKRRPLNQGDPGGTVDAVSQHLEEQLGRNRVVKGSADRQAGWPTGTGSPGRATAAVSAPR